MTAFQFAPTSTAVYQFQPVLDGSIYTGIVTWNIYGERWYLNLYSLSGVLIFCKALIGSPDSYDISLTWGYFFSSTMVFRQSSQTFEVTP